MKVAGIIGIVLAVLAVGAVGYAALGRTGPKEFLLGTAATVYKDPSCGCCGQYVVFLRSSSDLEVEVEMTSSLASFKDSMGIPADVRSCHVMVIGDYFIEGHVPLEAVQKLLADRPDIKGIALPGMPSGSPGMLGPKRGPWTVYAVHRDGSTSVFMTV